MMPLSAPRAPLAPVSAPSEAATISIVCIDDDCLVHALLSLILRRFDLTPASTGPDGLLLARQRRPDLILLDLMLPGLDGRAVCLALKADPATQAIPILALTGAPERAAGLPLAGCLAKPFTPAQLLEAVQAALAGGSHDAH